MENLNKQVLTKLAEINPDYLVRLNSLYERVDTCQTLADEIQTHIDQCLSDYARHSTYRLQLGKANELVLYRILRRTYVTGIEFIDGYQNADEPVIMSHNQLLKNGYKIDAEQVPMLQNNNFTIFYEASVKQQESDKREIRAYVNEYYEQHNQEVLQAAQAELEAYQVELLNIYNDYQERHSNALGLIDKLVS